MAKNLSLEKLSFPMLLAGLVAALLIILAATTFALMPRPDATIKVVIEPMPATSSTVDSTNE